MQVLDSLHIESSGVPIYVQIRDQILRAIGANLLKPGEKMPTMRQVAVALRIDLNTVRHAYDALARTGAITIQPARGTFVSNQPPPVNQPAQSERIDDLAHRAIASARAAAIDPTELAHRIIALHKQKEDHQ
jgi:GntR family transcriptional regulator